jgi:hypothetical protein
MRSRRADVLLRRMRRRAGRLVSCQTSTHRPFRTPSASPPLCSPTMTADSSSLLQRRRPAPLHLNTSNGNGAEPSAHQQNQYQHHQGGDGPMPSSSAMSAGLSGESNAGSGEPQGSPYSAAGQHTGNGYIPSSPFTPASGVNGPQYPSQTAPPTLPHSHSMPIPTSASSYHYNGGLYHAAHGAPYSAGPTTSSFPSGIQQPMSAPPVPPYGSLHPYSNSSAEGNNPPQPPSMVHTHSAPAVPLSASVNGSMLSPVYPSYPPASPYSQHPQGSGYRQQPGGTGSSSPYGSYVHTPHYQSFSYDQQPSSASSTHNGGQGGDFAQQQGQEYDDRGHRMPGVTPSGQRYPPFAAKVPLVDRPFKCDECVQSFVS